MIQYSYTVILYHYENEIITVTDTRINIKKILNEGSQAQKNTNNEKETVETDVREVLSLGSNSNWEEPGVGFGVLVTPHFLLLCSPSLCKTHQAVY